MATDLNMRIGSVTKTFVTTAILQLVDQGKISLDDPIGKYLPGVPNGETITIRQLAGMRSGLFDYSDVTQGAMPNDPKRRYTHQNLLEIIVKHPPEPAAIRRCPTVRLWMGPTGIRHGDGRLDT